MQGTETQSEALVGGKLRYLTTDWESLEIADHSTSKGEICYGDNLNIDGKDHPFSILVFSTPKKVSVTWGACTHEPYTSDQVKEFLQDRYQNRPGNWENVVQVP